MKGVCQVKWCDRPIFARKFCATCYKRLLQNNIIVPHSEEFNGDIHARPRAVAPPPSVEDRIAHARQGLRKEIDRAQGCYRLASGVSARLFWRAKIRLLEAENEALETIEARIDETGGRDTGAAGGKAAAPSLSKGDDA